MPRYVNTLDIDQVTIGANAGGMITTGTRNTFIGRQAGALITTGKNNVIVGAYEGTGDLNNSVVLSDGAGSTCFKWDPTTSLQLAVATEKSTTVDPPDNTLTIAYNSTTQGITMSARIAGKTYKSESATKAYIESLNVQAGSAVNVGTMTATDLITKVNNIKLQTGASGTSLIKDASTLNLRTISSSVSGLTVAVSSDQYSVVLGSTFGSQAVITGTSGTELVYDADRMKLKTISPGTGIEFDTSTNPSNIVIKNIGTASALTFANGGTSGTANSAELISGTSPNYTLRRIIGGTGVTVTSDTVNNTISLSSALSSTTAPANGFSLVSSTNKIRTISKGTGVTLNLVNDNIEIVNDSSPLSITLSTATSTDTNSADLVATAGGTGNALKLRRLMGGDGITLITDTATDQVTVKTTFGHVTGATVPSTPPTGATNPTTTYSLIGDAAAMKLRTITGSDGIGMELTNSGTNLNLKCTLNATAVTLATLGLSTTANSADIMGTYTNKDFKLRRLIGLTGITVAASTDGNGVEFGSNVTLASEALTPVPSGLTPAVLYSLISDNSAMPSLKTKRLWFDSNFKISSSADTLKVEYAGSTGATVSIASAGTDANSVSLISDATNPSFKFYGLLAGTGVSIASDTKGSLKISNTSLNSDVKLTSNGLAADGMDIVATQNGPSLAVRRLKAGTGVSIVQKDTTSLTFHNSMTHRAIMRINDVVSTAGQFCIVPQSSTISPAVCPTIMTTMALNVMNFPSLRYLPSTTSSHNGGFVFGLYNMPQKVDSYGFDVEFTVFSRSMSSISFNVTLAVPGPASGGQTWSMVSADGILTIPAFSISGGTGTDPPKTVAVTGLTSASMSNQTCLDGTTRLVFPSVTGQQILMSPVPVFVALSSSTAVTSAIDILGVRFTFNP